MGKPDGDRYLKRRDALKKILRENSLPAMLVTDPVNVSYLTGFTGEDSYLLVSKTTTLLISDARFTEQIAEDCPGLEAIIRRPGKQMPDIVGKTLKSAELKQVAFESSAMTVAGLERLQKGAKTVEWAPRSGDVEKLRAVKDADEVRQIREAIAVAERAFVRLRSSMNEEEDEKTLADRLDAFLRQEGAKGSAFGPIVAAGPRSALPHAIPTPDSRLGSGFILIDWGARCKFHHSDLTRVLVARKITPKFAKIYQVVLEANRRAIAKIRPGATGGEIDAVARSHIEQAGFGRRFGHSLGHGLGMQVHEAPSLRHKAENVLEPGMVVTVEPGIYLPGWGGIRLEDDVLVTKDGCEVLSTTPLELEEIVLAR